MGKCQMGKMSNGNYVKWEKCQMGNVKWECQMGMSNGNVKWEKCQMGKMSNGKNVKWDAFILNNFKYIGDWGLSPITIPNPQYQKKLKNSN